MEAELIKGLCELFGGRVLPDWYLKLPDEFYDNWPEGGAMRVEREEAVNARRWWLEKATELLVHPRPEKGLLRAAIESQKNSSPEMAAKLKEKLRVLR